MREVRRTICIQVAYDCRTTLRDRTKSSAAAPVAEKRQRLARCLAAVFMLAAAGYWTLITTVE